MFIPQKLVVEFCYSIWWFKLLVWNCSNKIVYRTEFYREEMYRKKFNLPLYRASTSFIAFTGSGTLLNHFCKGVFKWNYWKCKCGPHPVNNYIVVGKRLSIVCSLWIKLNSIIICSRQAGMHPRRNNPRLFQLDNRRALCTTH